MQFIKILTVPEGALTVRGAWSEPRTVQSGSVRSGENALLIRSSGRFKRFSDAKEYLRIEEGGGYIKWKRGELPFSAGDVFFADAPEEYDFYGAGKFLIVKAQEDKL